jgi:hypothetical protein
VYRKLGIVSQAELFAAFLESKGSASLRAPHIAFPLQSLDLFHSCANLRVSSPGTQQRRVSGRGVIAFVG